MKFEVIQQWRQLIKSLKADLVTQDVTENQIETALFIYCEDNFASEIEIPTDIYSLPLEYNSLLEYLAQYDFSLNAIKFDSTIGDVSPFLIIAFKAHVKAAGLNWVVHKYDADPFPSIPHAHEISNLFKLHLGNGYIYKKRKEVGKLRRKEFLDIRRKLSPCGVFPYPRK